MMSWLLRSRVGRTLDLLALWAILGTAAPARGDDIVVGMSAAFQGTSRDLGTEMYRGALAYFEHVNRTGGVQGRKIVLRAYDDGYNPGPAIQNTVRLIEQDKAFVLFGYVGTPTVTRVLPLLKMNENRSVYFFFPFTGAEPQRQPPYDQFVFNLRASYREETAGLVEQFLQVGRRRIAVFYQIDAYGRNGWEGVRLALAKHGLRITEEATYRRGAAFTDSMRPQVDLLRQSNPDAVICIGAYAACAAFVRDCRDAGWDVPVANVSFVGSESLLRLLVEHGRTNGRDYARNLINSQVVPSYHDLKLPAVVEYRKLMEEVRPQPPAQYRGEGQRLLDHSFVSFEGFLAAKLLVQVLQKSGPDRHKVRAAAESLHDVDLGLDVRAALGPQKHQALSRVYFTVAEGERFLPLTDWGRWKK
jgi:ABC-type branched-subunit amino acid transport system substrate-binding protein